MPRKAASGIRFLIRRGEGSYTYHRNLPRRLSPFFVGSILCPWNDRQVDLVGRAAVKISLSTTDLKTAEQRRDTLHALVENLLANARWAAKRKAAAKPKVELVNALDDDQIAALALQMRHRVLDLDDSRSLGLKGDFPAIKPGMDYLADVKTLLGVAQEALKDGIMAGFLVSVDERDLDPANSVVQQALTDNGIRLPPEHPDLQRAALAMMRSMVGALGEVIKRREEGGAIMTPPKPRLLNAGDEEVGLRLNDAFERYASERRLPEKTRDAYALYVRRWLELLGDLPLKQIRKAHVRQFKEAMLNCPAQIPPSHKDRAFTEIVEWGRAHPEVEKLSVGTINDRALGSLSAIFGWAVEAGFMDDNPRRGIRVIKSSVEADGRLPYDKEHLKFIFGLPIFQQPPERPLGGAGEAARWLPLLALYTGARLEEIGQLRVEDVKEEDGIHYLDMRAIDKTRGAETRRKTASSRRRVPLHGELIRCGLLAYVEAQQSAKCVRLFNQLTGNREITANFSKWWGRYVRKAGLKDPRLVFHSFRHTVKDAFRDCEVEETLARAIMGHESAGVASSYGAGYSLARLNDGVQKLRFPGVDLKHLYA